MTQEQTSRFRLRWFLWAAMVSISVLGILLAAWLAMRYSWVPRSDYTAYVIEASTVQVDLNDDETERMEAYMDAYITAVLEIQQEFPEYMVVEPVDGNMWFLWGKGTNAAFAQALVKHQDDFPPAFTQLYVFANNDDFSPDWAGEFSLGELLTDVLIPFICATAQHGNWDVSFRTLEIAAYLMAQDRYHGDLNMAYYVVSEYQKMFCQTYYLLSSFDGAPADMGQRFDDFIIYMQRGERSAAEYLSADCANMIRAAEETYRQGEWSMTQLNMPNWVLSVSKPEQTVFNIKNLMGERIFLAQHDKPVDAIWEKHESQFKKMGQRYRGKLAYVFLDDPIGAYSVMKKGTAFDPWKSERLVCAAYTHLYRVAIACQLYVHQHGVVPKTVAQLKLAEDVRLPERPIDMGEIEIIHNAEAWGIYAGTRPGEHPLSREELLGGAIVTNESYFLRQLRELKQAE